MSENKYYPLTNNQLGIYFDNIKNTGSTKYNIPFLIRFENSVEPIKLKNAIMSTINKRPYFKSRIVEIEDDIKVLRCDNLDINKISIVELDTFKEEDFKKEVKPFNLHNSQLFNFKIFKTKENTILFGDIHSLLADEYSINLLLNDIIKTYGGEDLVLESCDGFEYSLEDYSLKDSKEYNDSKVYFEGELMDFENPTNLTPDTSGDGEFKVLNRNLNKDRFLKFSKDKNIDLNTLVLASTVLNLSKFTFNKDILINTLSDGRYKKEYSNTEALLAKNLPFNYKRNNPSETIEEFLNNISNKWDDTLKHQFYPYYELASKFNLKNTFSFSYIKEFSNKNYLIEKLQHNFFDFSLNICEDKENLSLHIDYNSGLYTKDYVNLFLDGLETILNEIILSDISTFKVSDISLSNEGKYSVNFNELKTPILHEKFQMQVEETPDRIALISEDGEFTYRELNEKANRIANALIKKGVEARSNILVMLPRDSNLIATVLGILKTGSAFIPLDLDYPKDRIEYIYENSDANYIIVNDNIEGTLNVYDLIEDEDSSNPVVDISVDDLAYMIYTSGSTGKPKGVMISHKNITNLFEYSKDNPVFNLYSNMDKILALTTVSFDAFLLDLMSLTYGLTMVFASNKETKDIDALVTLIKKTKPDSFAIITPSRLLQYLESDDFLNEIKDFRNINLGGEALSEVIVKKLQENSDTNIYNLYGPTEATIMSNLKKISTSNEITVGKSLYNYITEVRDIDGQLVPKGLMGELYIGGYGVFKGYYNNKEKTDEVFTKINNIPYYKTGDYAIENLNGEIEIKGRIDNQIKLRGLRIEIDEVKNVITDYNGISDAVITVSKINDSEHLCAYFTSNKDIDIDELKDYLKSKLTQYMIPTVIMKLDKMPQTPNGKVDTSKLPEPKLELNYVLPESDTEKTLYELVSDIISFDEFGVTDNLYTLGFTSLNLMKLNTLIYKNLDVKLDITTLLNSPDIRSIASEIDNSSNTQIELDKRSFYPLSPNQLGIYYESVQDKNAKYNIPTIIRFNKTISVTRLKDSLIKTINTHPYLKMRIVNKDGVLLQKRMDDASLDEIEIIKTKTISDEEIRENIKNFQLEDNQLFEFKIYETETENVLFSNFHHIISDGVSQDKLLSDLVSIYDTGKVKNKEVIDGFTYSLIEEENSKNLRYLQSKEYFDEKLSSGIESTVLTPDKNGEADNGVLKEKFRRFNTETIKRLCQNNSISPNVLFMAINILNLNKFTFNKDTLITTIFNGRSNPDYQNTQGLLVKTLPIIFKNTDRDKTVKEFLKEVDINWKETLSNMHYPYTEIARKYQLKPEFFYTYHDNVKVDNIEINGENYEPEVLQSYSTNYKFSLDVFEKNDIIAIRARYNDELYSDAYVDLFLDGIETILNYLFINNTNTLKINEISLRNDSESTFNPKPLKTPILHENFELQVKESPDKLALLSDDGEFTYKELNEKANRIANALIKKGVKEKSNILVMLKRDSNLIATILGVLKTGSAYIPLDIDYPEDRIKYISGNSGADYIITNGDLENSLNVNTLLEETNTTNPNVKVSPSDLAYIIYTSGSTGKPKGVMISHKNITNLFEKDEENLVYNLYMSMERILATATVSFDVFLLDLMSLTYGITLVLANNNETKDINALTNLVKNTRPDSIAFMTPSRLLQYLEFKDFAEELKNFKYIGVGGEKLFEALTLKLDELSDALVYNVYGPTEATVTSNIKKITNPREITVGKALYNYITEVRDIDGKLLPKGIMGELYIGGNGVSKGYYNNKKKTDEAFTTIGNIPYYKTGDYAIEKLNGEIDIKGRIDNQIKLRGLRIELDEIKNTLDSYKNITFSVVLIKNISGNEHLCAYYTCDSEINLDELKEYLKNKLTDYMVPTVFKEIDTIPYTPNGKVDIKSLPEVELTKEYVPPSNKLEQSICAIFSEVLSIDTVGACDNFFEIGGTSLIASKLIIKLINEGYTLEYNDIFENQSPRELSNLLSGISTNDNSNTTIITDYDYTNINKFLEENTLENYFKGESQELGNILLTGVTGYLGVHILHEYLENETGTIYCLLRKGEYESISKRFIDLYKYYFNKDISNLLDSRIILVEGDITNPEDFNKVLNYDINTIINSAAIVKHYTHDDYIFKVNTDGVINGLDFAEKINSKYIQISTTSVGSILGDTKVPDFSFDEKTLYYGQDVTNKYVASKLLAERMVLERVSNGFNAKVIRVGNLMGRYSDGRFQKNFETNAFVNNLKAIKNLGAIPYNVLSSEVEMSPIDYVAKSIISLSKTPKESIVFHCFNDNNYYLSDLINALNSFGDEISNISSDEFETLLKENMDESIQGLINSNFLIGDTKHADIENNYTNTVLHNQGIYWPSSNIEYLNKFIGNLKDLDFFKK